MAGLHKAASLMQPPMLKFGRNSPREATKENDSARSSVISAQEIMFETDQMIAECHISFEKLLKHILSFSAKKDEQMIDHAQISVYSKVTSNK